MSNKVSGLHTGEHKELTYNMNRGQGAVDKYALQDFAGKKLAEQFKTNVVRLIDSVNDPPRRITRIKKKSMGVQLDKATGMLLTVTPLPAWMRKWLNRMEASLNIPEGYFNSVSLLKFAPHCYSECMPPRGESVGRTMLFISVRGNFTVTSDSERWGVKENERLCYKGFEELVYRQKHQRWVSISGVILSATRRTSAHLGFSDELEEKMGDEHRALLKAQEEKYSQDLLLEKKAILMDLYADATMDSTRIVREIGIANRSYIEMAGSDEQAGKHAEFMEKTHAMVIKLAEEHLERLKHELTPEPL